MLRDTTDLSGQRIFIGRVVRDQSRFARIEPLARAFDDGWEEVANPNEQFPTSGLVFNPDPTTAGQEGRIVLFRARENDKQATGRDRFIATDIDEPYEIHQEFAELSARDQRLVACDDGIKRFQQELPTIIIPLGNGKATVLPFVLNGRRWHVANDVDFTKIPIYEDREIFETDVRIEGRTFALPGRLPRDVVSYRNWQTDGDFLGSVLKALKRHSELADDNLTDISRSVMDRLGRAYTRAEIFSRNTSENRAIQERLGEFLQFVPGEVKALGKIASTLAHSKPVVERIEAEIAEMKRDAGARAEAEARIDVKSAVEREFEAARSEIAVLREEVEQLDTHKQALQDDLDGIRKSRTVELAALARDLEGFLTGIRAAGRDTDKIMELLKLSGVSLPGAERTADVPLAPPPPWQRYPASPQSAELTLPELPKALTDAGRTAGLEVAVLRRLDVVLRAGRIPCLLGDAADEFIETYASVLCGGLLCNVLLDPTILGPDDIWSRDNPSATAFRHAWETAAQEPDRPHLIVLRGLSRSSLTPWFPDFARMFVKSRPANLMVVAVCDDSDGAKSSPASTILRTPGSPGSQVASLFRAVTPSSKTSVVLAPFKSTLPSDAAIDLVGLLSDPDWMTHANAKDAVAYLETAMTWTEDHREAFNLVAEILGPSSESAHKST